jgi:hypothetical protein
MFQSAAPPRGVHRGRTGFLTWDEPMDDATSPAAGVPEICDAYVAFESW